MDMDEASLTVGPDHQLETVLRWFSAWDQPKRDVFFRQLLDRMVPSPQLVCLWYDVRISITKYYLLIVFSWQL